LVSDCGLGEQTSLEREVMKWGNAIEAVFIAAATQGPSQDALLREVEANARADYRERRTLLETAPNLRMPEEDRKRLLRVSEKEYVARIRADFVRGYRLRAVSALGLTGGEPGRKLLESISADRASPLRRTAEEALRYSKNR
jgi:hypothetical protein